MKKMVRKGVPPEYRGSVWMEMSGAAGGIDVPGFTPCMHGAGGSYSCMAASPSATLRCDWCGVEFAVTVSMTGFNCHCVVRCGFERAVLSSVEALKANRPITS